MYNVGNGLTPDYIYVNFAFLQTKDTLHKDMQIWIYKAASLLNNIKIIFMEHTLYYSYLGLCCCSRLSSSDRDHCWTIKLNMRKKDLSSFIEGTRTSCNLCIDHLTMFAMKIIILSLFI